jgi:GTP cyclohydrolase II
MISHTQFPTDDDSALLDILTGPNPASLKAVVLPRRDAALDPLLLAAAAASGPHVTRNHYAHDFFPGVMLPREEGSWDWANWKGRDATSTQRLTYVSRQGPRRARLGQQDKENDNPHENDPALKPLENVSAAHKRTRQTPATFPKPDTGNSEPPSSQVEVKCMARTRIPTPHGPAFLHLYHNNHDSKEHLAIVIDSAQYSEQSPVLAPPIRSHSLDAKWSDDETEMDRITRGAFVGKLSPNSQKASTPSSLQCSHPISDTIPAPLIRLHSECFTGETIGSMRCDCGEQLDEAIRLISQPIPISSQPGPTTIPGRGAVIYLRQEGRGIGLLSKIRAYNLQDLGHDTVTANLMLGHKADERGYEIAGAILRDLGLGSQGVRVLTNNPDKVQALAHENIKVVERVSMIPRSWQGRQQAQTQKGHQHSHHQQKLTRQVADDAVTLLQKEEKHRLAGATLIGGGAVYGEDLDKYLRTKVLRMGHMLPLWLEDPGEI